MDLNITIQNRDKEILLYLLKYRVATIYQLMRDLEVTSEQHHFSTRLKKLVLLKYLKSHWWERKLLYSLGANGQEWLNQMGELSKKYELSHLGHVASKATHDVLLNDVYHALEKVEIVHNLKTHNQFLIEDSAHSHISNVPDAKFEVQCDDINFVCALELELSAKTKIRYQKVMLVYHNDRNIPLVLYVAQHKPMKRLILQANREYLKFYTDKIYATTLDEFLKAPQFCVFESSAGEKFSFQSLMNRKNQVLLDLISRKNRFGDHYGDALRNSSNYEI